jgi:hypothetical protein
MESAITTRRATRGVQGEEIGSVLVAHYCETI